MDSPVAKIILEDSKTVSIILSNYSILKRSLSFLSLFPSLPYTLISSKQFPPSEVTIRIAWALVPTSTLFTVALTWLLVSNLQNVQYLLSLIWSLILVIAQQRYGDITTSKMAASALGLYSLIISWHSSSLFTLPTFS